jgi:DNA replication and repair protein RecF
MEYWDDLVASRGAMIISARIEAIQELEQLAVRIHEKLTDSREVIRLVYQPSYDPLSTPEGQYSLPMQIQVQRNGLSMDRIKQGFLNKLMSVRGEEIARGVTTIGPHRDEMRIQCNGLDLTDYGSRGQLRTAILSLKLAEVDWLKKHTSHWPVLLLDETLVELDNRRRELLLDYVQSAEQALLTTTDMNLFPHDFVDKCERWQVTHGKVERINQTH